MKDCFQTMRVEKLAKISRIDCMHWFDENDSVLNGGLLPSMSNENFS